MFYFSVLLLCFTFVFYFSSKVGLTLLTVDQPINTLTPIWFSYLPNYHVFDAVITSRYLHCIIYSYVMIVLQV